MGNPIIKSVADIHKARIDYLSTKANAISTMKQEAQKRRQEARDAGEERALTVQQRQREAEKRIQQDRQVAQESIEAVLPPSQVVRTDPKGMEAMLSTSAAANTAGLMGIPGGGAVQQKASGWNPGQSPSVIDPLGVNAYDPTAGGYVGTNFSIDPKTGQYYQTDRSSLRTGLPGLDVVNAIVGAARGGRPLLSTTERIERPDMARQQLMDAAASRAAEVAGKAAERAEFRADERLNLERKRVDFDARRVEFDEARLGLEQARLGLEGERVGMSLRQERRDIYQWEIQKAREAAAATFNREESLRKSYVDMSQDFVKQRNAFGRIESLAEEALAGSPIAGRSLVYALAQLNAPGIVTDKDFVNALQPGGVLGWMSNYLSLAESGKLSAPIVKDIRRQAKVMFLEAERQHVTTTKSFDRMAKEYGLKPGSVTDVGVERRPEEGAKRGAKPAKIPQSKTGKEDDFQGYVEIPE